MSDVFTTIKKIQLTKNKIHCIQTYTNSFINTNILHALFLCAIKISYSTST